MYIPLLLGGAFYKCQIRSSWQFYSNLIYSYFLFSISINEKRVPKSSTVTVDLSIIPHSSTSFSSCILNLCYKVHKRLWLLFSSDEFIPLSKWLSLALVIVFALKSPSPKINIATSASFWPVWTHYIFSFKIYCSFLISNIQLDLAFLSNLMISAF